MPLFEISSARVWIILLVRDVFKAFMPSDQEGRTISERAYAAMQVITDILAFLLELGKDAERSIESSSLAFECISQMQQIADTTRE